jgi:hypothetical protein
MIQIVREVSPVQILDMDIEAARKRVSDLEASRPHVLQIEEMNKTKVCQSTTSVVDSIFLEQRESRLQDKSLISMIIECRAFMDRFYFKCGFQSSAEAKTVLVRSMKRGLVKDRFPVRSLCGREIHLTQSQTKSMF